MGLTPKEEQSFQGLIDHLSLAFQSCKSVSSLIADFYNRSQKIQETEDAFAEELQVLIQKIVALKPEFKGEANQALKHQFAQNLRDPYFGVVARGQCLSSPDSKIFTQFQGRLALMFNSQGKQCVKANITTAAVDSRDQEHLSHNSRQRQAKINAQAAEIANMKSELNKALQENKKLKSLFSPEKMVEAMTKAVSAMTVQSHPTSTSSKGTQYQGTSSFIGRPRPPQLACGADGMLLPSVTCNYCKDTGHFKDNCVQLNNKIAQELAQEQATQKASTKPGATSPVPKK